MLGPNEAVWNLGNYSAYLLFINFLGCLIPLQVSYIFVGMATLPDEEIVVQIDDRQQVRVWRRQKTCLGSSCANENTQSSQSTLKTDSNEILSLELQK